MKIIHPCLRFRNILIDCIDKTGLGKNSQVSLSLYNKVVPFFGVRPSSGSVLKCLFLFCLWLFIDMIMTGYGKLEKFPFSSSPQTNSAYDLGNKQSNV